MGPNSGDDYCRLVAEVCDFADKQGINDDRFLLPFAYACAEVYVNERILDLSNLKDIYKADWQQAFLISLQDRMMKELEVEEDNASVLNIPSPRKRTRTDEIMDMMFPEGIDDGFSLPED